MNIGRFSIRRPVLLLSLVVLLTGTGAFALSRMGVDLYPEANFPSISITTQYPGAGPQEIEELISRPLEDELGSLSGLKTIRSQNLDGVSVVLLEFTLETDVKDAEQQARDRVARVRVRFPEDAEESQIMRFDLSDLPIARIALSADLPPAKLYDIARERVKPRLDQVPDVGVVNIVGGRRREIQVELDRDRLRAFDLSATSIAASLRDSGRNAPLGTIPAGEREIAYRNVAQFSSIDQIKDVVVAFGDIGQSVTLEEVGRVYDGLEDEATRGYLYRAPPAESRSLFAGWFDLGAAEKPTAQSPPPSQPALFLEVYRKSGANTVAVADAVQKRMQTLNQDLERLPGKPRLELVYDGAHEVRINIADVRGHILLGIALTVVVVYFFLGNLRSTIITGLALPNSLLGAFILMYVAGFTVNIMTLLALTLAVGLLVDDAIVVRENIFRKLEEGLPPHVASEKGVNEVAMAVVATTLTVIAVFLPVSFLGGMIGQFFRQFGLTVVFALLISLFDGLFIAPMLSAYYSGKAHAAANRFVRAFDAFQTRLENLYAAALDWVLRFPRTTALAALGVFVISIGSLAFVKLDFFSDSDAGEFTIALELPPGAALDATAAAALKFEQRIKSLEDVRLMTVTAGGQNFEKNKAQIYVRLAPFNERQRSTTEVKNEIRAWFGEFADLRPRFEEQGGGGHGAPFQLNLRGDDLAVVKRYSEQLAARLRESPDLLDLDVDYREGKPEFQIRFIPERMQLAGVSSGAAALELRYQAAGDVVAQLNQGGIEYDVRLRAEPEERRLDREFQEIRVPNVQGRLAPLSALAVGEEVAGPAAINREDRSRVVQVKANLTPDGALGSAMQYARRIVEQELPPPEGVEYQFVGSAEDLAELTSNILIAFGFAVLMIYLTLAALYESFITPMTILTAIPPAISGAFLALAITGQQMNIFSMIGVIMLLGLVVKNSILLVDHALQRVRAGEDRDAAIRHAGVHRLRPILMTTFAMIAGTLPIALGLGEVGRLRMSMGVVIIGGLIVSTVVTLLVVPALFGWIDQLRVRRERRFIEIGERIAEDETVTGGRGKRA